MNRICSPFLKISLLLILFLFQNNLFAQTFTSEKDGDWNDSTVWGQSSYPGPNDAVVVNHEIYLDTSWIAKSPITVSDSGHLIGDVFELKGTNALYSNNGRSDFASFELINGAILLNTNTFFIDSVLINDGSIINYTLGILTSANIYNEPPGIIDNMGVLGFLIGINNGAMVNSNLILGFYFVNSGDIKNSSSGNININNFWNLATCYNDSISNINVSNDFWNYDSTQTTGAVFVNDGFLGVGNDWSNSDTIKGGSSGQICVGGYSINKGEMIGAFEFCDTSSNSSVVDFNTGGNIDLTIICNSACKLYAAENTINPSCYEICDGEVEIIAFGGDTSSVYTFSANSPIAFFGHDSLWLLDSSSVDSLCEGVYMVLISDGSDSLFHLGGISNPSPIGLTMSSTSSSCGNGTATVEVFDGGILPFTYEWSNGDTTFVSQDTASIMGLSNGNYYVTVIDSNQCISVDSVLVDSIMEPELDVDVEMASCPDNSDGSISISFTSQVNSNLYTYKWSDISSQTNSTANDLISGKYFVTITDTSTSCLMVYNFLVESEVSDSCFKWKIFNGFTPNDDNLDDKWRIRGLANYEDVVVNVFNNRGVIVWESKDYQNHWDGTDTNGLPLPEGIYYYIVQRDDEYFRGWVSLLR